MPRYNAFSNLKCCANIKNGWLKQMRNISFWDKSTAKIVEIMFCLSLSGNNYLFKDPRKIHSAFLFFNPELLENFCFSFTELYEKRKKAYILRMHFGDRYLTWKMKTLILGFLCCGRFLCLITRASSDFFLDWNSERSGIPEPNFF